MKFKIDQSIFLVDKENPINLELLAIVSNAERDTSPILKTKKV